jgi:uncharacterized protein YndB with AHSA1/START domain
MSKRDPGGYRRTWIDHSSDIPASVRDVYELLADIDRWPSWVPGVAAVHRKERGRIAVGDRFTMLVKPAAWHPPLPIPCRVLRVEPTHIEWGGGLPGSEVRHSFALTELAPKKTRVRQIEYATNVLAVLARVAEPGIYKHNLRMQNALGEYAVGIVGEPERNEGGVTNA